MRDVHTFTRRQAVAGLPALLHTPEVNQSEGAGPPHCGAISVSLEGRSSRSGLLLFHRAIRSNVVVGNSIRLASGVELGDALG